MIRVHFECMGSMPALVLETTDVDEAAFLKVIGFQIKDGSSKMYASIREDEATVKLPYGIPVDETTTRLTLDLLPDD